MLLCQDVEVSLEYSEGANDPNQLKNYSLWLQDMWSTTFFDFDQRPLHWVVSNRQVNKDGSHAMKRFPPAKTFHCHNWHKGGGQDDKDSCPLRPKHWTNTVPGEKSQSGHLNKASETSRDLIRIWSFKSFCDFGFIVYPKRSGLSIASRPFG